MGISEYIINVVSAVIAVEYIDYGFQKKYSGVRRFSLFAAGCAVYFLTVTTLNLITGFEGVLGLLYGVVLMGYAILALKGRWQDFLLAGILWVLIAMLGTYCMLSIPGIVKGEGLAEMLQQEDGGRFYASVVALVVNFSMGKIAAVLFRKQENSYKRENGIVAGAFLFMTLLAMGLFLLEAGEFGRSARYGLTIWILLDEVGIIFFLVQMYHCMEKYQQEKLEEQNRREKEAERWEDLQDMYRVSREINHWRHDMQGELEVLYRMMKSGKYMEVEAHMERLCNGLKDYPELPQPTGNEGLDAVLMKMIPKCRERRIHFSYVVMGRPDKIGSIVLGTLINNLLCNGMEACGNLPGYREMELVVQERGEGLEICLENSIGESVLENNPELASRKQEKEKHGFGMDSIRRIVENHDGVYKYWEEYKEEELIFCQHIYLSYIG